MTGKPRKPLLVNLTWAAVLLFAPVAYVLSWGVLIYGFSKGDVTPEAIGTLEDTVYRPIIWYITKEYPGSGWLMDFQDSCLGPLLGESGD